MSKEDLKSKKCEISSNIQWHKDEEREVGIKIENLKESFICFPETEDVLDGFPKNEEEELISIDSIDKII